MNKFLKIALFIWYDVIYIISFLVPKNKNLWIFGAWFGEKYADNSKYLFEYVNANHSETRAVWLTKNNSTLEVIRKKGFEAYHAYSIKGIILALRAKVAVMSQCYLDVTEFALGNIKKVQLWHGTPLKKIMKDIQYNSIDVSWVFPFLNRTYSKSLLIVPSQEVVSSISTAFQVPKSYIKITGYPRNDAFFVNDILKPVKTLSIYDIFRQKKNIPAIGIYMPTHRRSGEFDIFSLFQKNIEPINNELKKLGVILLVKFHFFHLESLEKKDINKSNIIFLKDEDINQDIYPVLPHTDFLITDYSSIYFDYLLLNKPIIFAPFDKDDYIKNDRDFYYDYDTVTPGPKATDWNEVLRCIKLFKDNPQLYSDERIKTRDLFNKYLDGNSSHRVYEEIIRFIN